MKFEAHFFLLNYDFSPEFAEAHHNGEPSENNRFYDWEDELALKNEVEDVTVLRHATYKLQGTKGDGSSFVEPVAEMVLFEIKGTDGSITQMGCSERALDLYEIDKQKEGKIILTVVLNAREPLSNPVPGIYIAAQDFPKSLID